MSKESELQRSQEDEIFRRVVDEFREAGIPVEIWVDCLGLVYAGYSYVYLGPEITAQSFRDMTRRVESGEIGKHVSHKH